MRHYRNIAMATAMALILPGVATAADKHELYSHLPNTALSGVIDSQMASRASIAKALPKTPKDPNKIVIGWTEITLGNPWFVEVVEAAKRKAKEYGGFTIDVQVADGDPSKTSAHFDSFIAQGVDVIVVDPTDVVGAATDAQRAVDAGIPVVALGTVPDASGPFVTTVLANPFGNGFEAGIYTAKHIGKDTPIVAGVTIGTLGNSTSESRITGLLSGVVFERSEELKLGMSREDAQLKGFNLFQDLKNKGSFNWTEGRFEVVGIQPGGWTEEGGLKGAEDLLAGYGGKINLILAENDFMGIGAIKAIENVGKKGQIVVACAADGFRVALDLIKSGDLLVTGANSGRSTGEGVMKLLDEMFHKNFDANDLPLGSYFPSEIITKENVDKFYDPDQSNPFFKYEVPPFRTVSDLRG
ncbi:MULTISPECIES: sugar ABC transporter substrate-binding protein [unclassified Rhizobium]|uniref:sugar ABC transporter substrate-binding protein n=1 Tax=unclassified Rhizobium TaxID=2613769 RepID=UPI000411A082|nr:MULTISPECIES: sugar ABC transporter substrate-binding protein [unclassified Rhizobium]MBD9455004.1 sugar ABC transporter substrate-binding protein [Rhizobium sp. RHZ02]